MLIHCIKETVKQEDFLENQEGEAHDKVKCGKFTICPVLFLNKHKFIVYREVNQECSPFR